MNEIAPRPHNSGHHTIEACNTSQYENHLRAILSLPLGSTSLRTSSAAMINILGIDGNMSPVLSMADAALPVEGATTHLYGKAESRKARKMGHVTITASSEAELRDRMRPILEAQADLKAEFINTICPSPQTGHSHPFPLVGIIMGSDSDLPTMLPATKILDKFKIPYELTITSAHRTPARMVEYAHSAVGRGLRVIIAGAGGAAHLPGMVASETAVPVIGVPVKASVLDGVDSLYSIVQMPVSLDYSSMSSSSQLHSVLMEFIERYPCSYCRYQQFNERCFARYPYTRRRSTPPLQGDRSVRRISRGGSTTKSREPRFRRLGQICRN